MDGGVGVALDHVALVAQRVLLVAQPLAPAELTLDRGLGEPAVAALPAVPVTDEHTHLPQPGLPLAVDGVALSEHVAHAEAGVGLDTFSVGVPTMR